jgi:PleD family two-component response regulator
VTMSFGVAGSSGPGLERQRLLDEADAALYEAKARGRDQVVAAAHPAVAATAAAVGGGAGA